MPLRALKNRSLSDRVFEQLGAEILLGRYAPGHSLPSERALSELFDVNRHVVREAQKRLQQVGLLSIAQGGAPPACSTIASMPGSICSRCSRITRAPAPRRCAIAIACGLPSHRVGCVCSSNREHG
jgi:DNA-binding transcriptional MocR family regulator